jgi:hypothetical protein
MSCQLAVTKQQKYCDIMIPVAVSAGNLTAVPQQYTSQRAVWFYKQQAVWNTVVSTSENATCWFWGSLASRFCTPTTPCATDSILVGSGSTFIEHAPRCPHDILHQRPWHPHTRHPAPTTPASTHTTSCTNDPGIHTDRYDIQILSIGHSFSPITAAGCPPVVCGSRMKRLIYIMW